LIPASWLNQESRVLCVLRLGGSGLCRFRLHAAGLGARVPLCGMRASRLRRMYGHPQHAALPAWPRILPSRPFNAMIIQRRLFRRGDMKPKKEIRPKLDTDRIDDAVLALMYLTLHDGGRVWKGFDWETMNRLFEKGLISDPVSKAKSVWLSDETRARSKQLFEQMFVVKD
jgi:hypothetical protein